MSATGQRPTDQASSPDRPSGVGRIHLRHRLANWLGASTLLLTLGGLALVQWIDSTNRRNKVEVADVPVEAAGLLLVAGLLILVLRVPTRMSITLTVAFALWLGLAWVNPVGENGGDYLVLAAIAIGLTLAVAVTPARWSGWVLLCVGTAFVWMNWAAMALSFATAGRRLPGAANWWSDRGWTATLTATPPWAQSRGGLVAWIGDRLSDRVPGFIEVGLSSNPNATGNAIVFTLVFAVSFAVSQTRTLRRLRSRSLALGGLVILTLLPGLALLRALEATSALGAALLGMAAALVPGRWLSSRPAAVAGAALPMAILIPFVLSRVFGLSLHGRNCVWLDWITVIKDSPLWGIGPPGPFPGQSCGIPLWGHPHNELLQAWSVAGILGAMVAFGTLSWLGWLAVRHHSRDGRALLAVMVAATVIMSVEVLSMARDWRWAGFAAFMAIAARSVAMYSSDADYPDEGGQLVAEEHAGRDLPG